MIFLFNRALSTHQSTFPKIARAADVEKRNPHGRAWISTTRTTSTILSIAVPGTAATRILGKRGCRRKARPRPNSPGRVQDCCNGKRVVNPKKPVPTAPCFPELDRGQNAGGGGRSLPRESWCPSHPPGPGLTLHGYNSPSCSSFGAHLLL